MRNAEFRPNADCGRGIRDQGEVVRREISRLAPESLYPRSSSAVRIGSNLPSQLFSRIPHPSHHSPLFRALQFRRHRAQVFAHPAVHPHRAEPRTPERAPILRRRPLMPRPAISLDRIPARVRLEVRDAAEQRGHRPQSRLELERRHILQHIAAHDDVEWPAQRPVDRLERSERPAPDPPPPSEPRDHVIARVHSDVPDSRPQLLEWRAPGGLAAPDVEHRSDSPLQQRLGDRHHEADLPRHGHGRRDADSRIAVPPVEVRSVIPLHDVRSSVFGLPSSVCFQVERMKRHPASSARDVANTPEGMRITPGRTASIIACCAIGRGMFSPFASIPAMRSSARLQQSTIAPRAIIVSSPPSGNVINSLSPVFSLMNGLRLVGSPVVGSLSLSPSPSLTRPHMSSLSPPGKPWCRNTSTAAMSASVVLYTSL